jgi:hypothetical protein
MESMGKVGARCLFGLAWAVLGCGDDSGGSGVSDSAQLATLSVADTQALCEEFTTTYQASVPSKQQTCMLAAATVSNTKAECTQFYELCTADNKTVVDQSSDTDCGDVDISDAGDLTPANCAASVGEWRACFKERIAAYEAVVKTASCENPSVVQSSQDTLGAACTTLFKKCPGVQP